MTTMKPAPGPALSPALGHWAATLAAGLAAGALSAAIAVVGDGDGRTVDAAHRIASGYLPYVVIVVLVGATAPGAVHAAVRAALSQLIMVWGYYTWRPTGTFATTYRTALNYALSWSALAVTAVPLVALGAFAIRCGLLAALRRRP
ncbi:hypothetical protein [Streptacidiphilus sp. PAMC 29251]